MRPVPLLAGITDAILHLHGWAALALVFALPALEASAFVGFIFPGEIAVLLGGVLAYQGRISLGAALAAAILGAVVGDSAGYVIGRKWGRAILRGTIGKLPVIREHIDKNWTGRGFAQANLSGIFDRDQPFACRDE